MLIKNEISLKGIIGQQYYGSTIMIILYILSLFGCVLIGIILLKICIACFGSQNGLFFHNANSDEGLNTPDLNTNSNANHLPVSSISQKTVTNLENMLLKFTQTQVSIEEKKLCICPICANNHRFTYPINKRFNTSQETIIRKNMNDSETIKMDGNNNVVNHVVSRLVMPLVNHRQPMKKIQPKNDTINGLKQFGSYSDVVLELKQKFSSNSALNTDQVIQF